VIPVHKTLHDSEFNCSIKSAVLSFFHALLLSVARLQCCGLQHSSWRAFGADLRLIYSNCSKLLQTGLDQYHYRPMILTQKSFLTNRIQIQGCYWDSLLASMNPSLPQLLPKPHHDRWRYCISITAKYSIHVGHQQKRTIMHVRRTCTHGLEPSEGQCKQI